MNIYCIYKATNSQNGKAYIGFAARWPDRKTEHFNESYRTNSPCYHTHFHRAIRHHGWDSFDWEIIYQSKDGSHTLKEMERHFIEEYDAFNSGYNQTLGGQGSLGRKHSDETKAKIKAKRALQITTDETRAKLSLAHRGKPKPKPNTEEYKAKMSAALRGKGLGVPKSEDMKKKLSAYQKVRNADPDIIAAKRSKMTDLWNDPEWRANTTAKIKAACKP